MSLKASLVYCQCHWGNGVENRRDAYAEVETQGQIQNGNNGVQVNFAVMSNSFPIVVDGQCDNDEADQDSGEQEPPELFATGLPGLSPGTERPCKCSRYAMWVISRVFPGPGNVILTIISFVLLRLVRIVPRPS